MSTGSSTGARRVSCRSSARCWRGAGIGSSASPPDQKRETTLRLLADRMGCLKAGTVANVIVPHPDYVRFAAHYGFRPDCTDTACPLA